MSNKQCFNSRFCVSPLLSNYLIKRFVIPKVCLLINKLIHTCSPSVGISHTFEINIATISKHNTKGLDFRISDMILQNLSDPHQAGEMAFKLASIYITVLIRVALQTPFWLL